MTVITVGDAEIRRVEEMTINSSIPYLTRDEALIAANRHWLVPNFLDEKGRWDLKFQSWILQVDSKVFVIDPRTGNGRPHIQPWFDRLDLPFIERFTATGIRPEDVDYVFCTHLHHDHCGWSTQLRDGRYVPTFPRASYMYVRREYERWDPGRPGHRVVDYNVDVFHRSVLPVMEAGLAKLVDDRHRICASVSIEPAYGHTEGHSMLHLVSRSQEAYFTGDVFHHPVQMVDPEIHFPGCDNLQMAIETRRRLIPHLAHSNSLVIPAHFPAPHAGWIRQHGGGFTFEALPKRIAGR